MFCTFLTLSFQGFAQEGAPQKKALVLFDGKDVPTNLARGDGRELAQLLGHFTLSITLQGVADYRSGELQNFDVIFFVGFGRHYDPPDKFLKDVYHSDKTICWINTGIQYFDKTFDMGKRYGFKFVSFDTATNFNVVKVNDWLFPKGDVNTNIITVTNTNLCRVIATTINSKKQEVPYAVRSGNFWYFVDSPLSMVTENDRYIFFADILHDIVGEQHAESHTALIRIEDVDPFENPARLREIADILYAEGIPFSVSLIPFFVDPSNGIRVSLSDKPDFVDAIHYMVEHGATIVLHGSTHQYKGQTATDFEFWDGTTNKPIKNDSKEYVEKKLQMGIEECMRNGIYPLIWETPHYTASSLDYSVISKFFSSCMEQRLAIDNFDYSQSFPFIIYHDLYGQRIYPENLGYVPLDEDKNRELESVDQLLQAAQQNLYLRDGFASAFFHSFVSLEALKKLVEGVKALGYTYKDLKQDANIVKLHDKVIVSKNGDISLRLDEQYVREVLFDETGTIREDQTSSDRMKGELKKHVDVPPGWIYVAEPSEFKHREISFEERLRYNVRNIWEKIFPPKKVRQEAKVLFVLDTTARGGGRNDQRSFIAAFRSLNIQVDTILPKQRFPLDNYNLLIVPYEAVDDLPDSAFDAIVNFVENGGCLITDTKNEVAQELGIKFTTASIRVEGIIDKLFPEEQIHWREPEAMYKFDVESNDEVFCLDERTQTPVVIGRNYGDGKILFLGTRFDPVSDAGYSRYPYLLEYVQKYFHLYPIVRSDNIEVYFDPGLRKISIEDLVKSWREHGVRIIHVAGWHTYPTWTYDYGKLIDLCHANGMLVYAWLEPPQVTKMFWDRHPEWRERNYLGQDTIQSGWRYAVALTDSSCLRATLDEFTMFLDKYDWDGVNLAELYFESGSKGPADAKHFTPMHPSVRNDFKKRYGFDPAYIFDQNSGFYWKNNPGVWREFEDYRVELIAYLHDKFLARLTEIKNRKEGFHIIVTAMDNLTVPELRRNIGVDILKIIELKNKYQFTLQVEDPANLWSTDPRRYLVIWNKYKAILGSKADLMLDLNILSFRGEAKTIFPTAIQTGIECYQLVNVVSSVAERFAIYSEATVNPQDFKLLPFATSGQVKINRIDGGWEIESPRSFTLNIAEEYHTILIDGRKHLSRKGGIFLVPSGRHIIKVSAEGPFSMEELGAKILTITGNLLYEYDSATNIEFGYLSLTRCIITLNKAPLAVIVDGKPYAPKVLKGSEHYGVILPPGEHKVLVVLESQIAYSVDITSLWSSSIIVLFGLVSGGMLIAFYVTVRIHRRREEKF